MLPTQQGKPARRAFDPEVKLTLFQEDRIWEKVLNKRETHVNME